ncbi:hypothetical protein BMS3Abin15_00842 [bacterium BMS3Abin15]|nr:hypothetical protein BMS3Abin15_00842 [bacterium BMS3Abin15]
MIICLDFNFLREIRSGDLLTYFALLLAYLAYTRSINRSLDSWKSLLISLKNDLKSQKEWLDSEYFEETYKDKNSFDPFKIIFPLSFESLPEIIRRGVAEFSWISDKFINQLSLFNERTIAFNSFLDHLKKVISANPVMTEKLKDKLNDLGIDKKSIEFDDLKKKIYELKKEDEIFYLAENIRRLNRLVHVKLIGNKNKKDKLHYLYFEITNELENILKNFDKKRPFFIKHKIIIGAFSLLLFLLIEIFLK